MKMTKMMKPTPLPTRLASSSVDHRTLLMKSFLFAVDSPLARRSSGRVTRG
jgi:hypothetical protein